MIALLKRNDPILLLLSPLVIVFFTLSEVLMSGGLINSIGAANALAFDWNPWFKYVLINLLAIAVVFLLNRIVQNSILIGQLSSLPMVLMAMMIGCLPLSSLAIAPFLGVFLQLLLFRLVLDLPEGTKTSQKAFNSAVIIGALMFFEPWSLLLLWLPVQAMLSTGVFSAKRFIIQVFGLITPLYLTNAVLYIAAWPLFFPWNSFEFSIPYPTFDMEGILPLFFLGIVSIVALLSIGQISSSSTLREKRKWYLVVSYFAIALLLITQNGFGNGLYFMLIPASVILARVFLNGRNRRLVNFGLVLLIALVFAINLW